MSRIVYVNGSFVAEDEAFVSVFDRGFLFADGVYEVTAVIDGRMVDNESHLARLRRSLDELKMDLPHSGDDLVEIQRELIERNGLEEGLVYLQATRGAADRDFRFPVDVEPTLVLFTQSRKLIEDAVAARGIHVITVPDIRWKRRDIKTVGLLAASLARQQAADAGADDAWMVEDGLVTEGSSNNAWIILDDDTLVTRHLGNEILHGITRAAVLELSRREGLSIVERPFTVDEAIDAREAFVTSAGAFVTPVVRINDHAVADGRPGEIATRLRSLYIDLARAASDRGA